MNDRDKFDRFTDRAKRVLSLAQEEAQRFQHNYIGTEHLLLGLIREEEGVAAHVLQSLGAKLNKVRSAVEFIIGRGDRIVLGEIGLTPRAKKVIELAVDEARRLHHNYIGTEHLLLGLVREGEGIAAGVLESFGIKLQQVRKATMTILQQPAGEHEPGTGTPQTPGEPDTSAATVSSSSFYSFSRQERFDRFTERARKVLTLAQEEAQRFQHNYIGTEHLLLGLVSEGGGVAAKSLNMLGVELERIRTSVEAIIGRGDRIVLGNIGLTPPAKKVIELAIDEARRVNHHYIGTEHILLGLIREGEGIAADVLESLGVNLEKARTAVINILSQPASSSIQVSSQADAGEIFIDDKDADEIIITDQKVSPFQDEDDLTPAPASEQSDVPGVFSIRATRVLDAAQEEARRRQVNYVGTDHLLLGLISEEKGLAAQILQDLNVDRETIRGTVEFIIAHSGSRTVPDVIGFTPRSRKVIQLAVTEAGNWNRPLVGTEHLLLGILREGEGIAAGVLISLGVSLGKALLQLQRLQS